MTDSKNYVQHVLDHYKEEASRHGTSEASTMWDKTTRQRELDAVLSLVRHLSGDQVAATKLLEIGAGNGVLMDHMVRAMPALRPVALEFSPDMFRVAQSRDLPHVEWIQGDVRALPFTAGAFDIVVSERCIINLMDRAHQEEALREVGRVLKPGGHYVCIEAFTDGLENMNQARQDVGLPAIPQAHHNLWFDKAWFREKASESFDIVELAQSPSLPQENFLSSHYFTSRVLYPAVSKKEPAYNSTFASFFSFLPPYGNFSPIQLFLLRKR
jgi:ubiquinone/menaquinone biosynthesis C-methylase UbiE